MSFTNYVVDLT